MSGDASNDRRKTNSYVNINMRKYGEKKKRKKITEKYSLFSEIFFKFDRNDFFGVETLSLLSADMRRLDARVTIRQRIKMEENILNNGFFKRKMHYHETNELLGHKTECI